jgi:hypothetical protein
MALSFFHRKDAEGAEDNDFMFAVERPRLICRDASNGKHKGQFTL